MRVETGSEMAVKAPQDEYVLSISDLLQVIWRRLWIIVLVTTIFVGAAIGFDFLQSPTYEASIKILVGQEQSTETNNLQGEIEGLQQLTMTMEEAVKTRPVAETVVQQLDLQVPPDYFLRNLSVEQVSGSQFIEVSYEHSSPEMAQLIANTVGEVFSERVSEVSPSANAITATVWEEASVPSSPANSNPLRDGALAFVLGIMLGTALAFLLEHFDDRWRSPEEVEQISGVPTLSVIPEFRVPKEVSKFRVPKEASKKGGH
jgi:capsular polysaccharide biosynthesis protein